MGTRSPWQTSRGRWLALTAAFLGWMFDGLEMGLFPLVARPALRDLLGSADEALIGRWFSVATAGFLVGAATGGVLFGWLGDRLGRVRAMSLSVLTYAIFTGLCGMARQPWQIALLRFVSALGMGGEWSLGVALVMEIWPDRARGLLAGLIGAAANLGYLLIALVGRGLGQFLGDVERGLRTAGLDDAAVRFLAGHSGWRLLMMAGALPALLTFFIRLCVPESDRWREEHGRGATSSWAARDLLGVAVGVCAAVAIIYLWAVEDPFHGLVDAAGPRLAFRIAASLAALAVVAAGYTYPVFRYLRRGEAGLAGTPSAVAPILGRMLLGAGLGGIALLGTWASIQWAPLWADQLAQGTAQSARDLTQVSTALGAVVGTFLAALLGNRLGRRVTYSLLCVGSLVSALVFFRLHTAYGPGFLVAAGVAGAWTASFYGWLPLYLPELFPTRIRATGQGFSYNFGRILAAVGVLQTGNLMGLFRGGYPQACSVMSLVYLAGLALIWLAPETHGQPLPE